MTLLFDDDAEQRALEAEFKRLFAEQERLKMSEDLDAWKLHIAALIDYQARVERQLAQTLRRAVSKAERRTNDARR